MKTAKINWTKLAVGAILLIAGIILTILLRTSALAENAEKAQTIPFALSLILALIGLSLVVSSRQGPKTNIYTLTAASLFAALCYIGFALLKIDISVGGATSAFHFGNVFCVLAALLLGGYWGGMAGAVGMTIGDLTTSYVTSAPKTFLLKLLIGLIVGLVAHKLLHLDKETKPQNMIWKSCAASIAGMGFNVIADPVVGYFYKTYLFGIPQDWAKTMAKISAMTTLVNAIVAVIAATILYSAIRPALRRAGLQK